MNLIVVSSLSCDEGLYFRYITMIAKEELDLEILLEAQKQDVDYYFNLLKKHGWFDFVDDFVLPEITSRPPSKLSYQYRPCPRD